MSRIGKQPIKLSDKTKVDLTDSLVTVTGPRGTLSYTTLPGISVALDGDQLVVTRSSDEKSQRALHGLTRALINNMVVGVNSGFQKELHIIGVGYRAELKGKILVLNLGYSHPIIFNAPEGVDIAVDGKANKITVSGISKEMVGQAAAKIRSFRKPEPYKGKGIRYSDEYVRTKAGKTAGSGAAA